MKHNDAYGTKRAANVNNGRRRRNSSSNSMTLLNFSDTGSLAKIAKQRGVDTKRNGKFCCRLVVNHENKSTAKGHPAFREVFLFPSLPLCDPYKLIVRFLFVSPSVPAVVTMR